MQDQSEKIKQDLRTIADILLLNGTLTECTGLVHGKMGIAVFFFHYARYTGNELFTDYSMYLIGELLNQIHINSNADYEKGIAGIGVGIDYLIQNNFLDVDEDICEDFDIRMVRAIRYEQWKDFSLYNGLTGYGRYWITRTRYKTPLIKARKNLIYIIENIEEKLPEMSIFEQTDVYCFLHDLQGLSNIIDIRIIDFLLDKFRKRWELHLLDINHSFLRLDNSEVGNIVRMIQQYRYFNCVCKDEINNTLTQISDLNMEQLPENTGLLNGYAGEGMIRLSALEPSNTTWTNLL